MSAEYTAHCNLQPEEFTPHNAKCTLHSEHCTVDTVVIYCTEMHYTALHTALHCTVLLFTVVYCTVLHFTAFCFLPSWCWEMQKTWTGYWNIDTWGDGGIPPTISEDLCWICINLFVPNLTIMKVYNFVNKNSFFLSYKMSKKKQKN